MSRGVRPKQPQEVHAGPGDGAAEWIIGVVREIQNAGVSKVVTRGGIQRCYRMAEPAEKANALNTFSSHAESVITVVRWQQLVL